MADIEISYDDSVISSMSSSGTDILSTAGKYLTDDITINYKRPIPPPKPKNVQVYIGRFTTDSTTYIQTSLSLTVTKTGYYNIAWTAWLDGSTSTSPGTQLYINNTLTTTETTFIYQGQNPSLSNYQLNSGDVVSIWAKSATFGHIYVANLIIKEN